MTDNAGSGESCHTLWTEDIRNGGRHSPLWGGVDANPLHQALNHLPLHGLIVSLLHILDARPEPLQ